MDILIDWEIITMYFNGLVYLTVGASQYCGLEIEFKVNLEPNQAKELIDAVVAKSKIELQELSESMTVRLYNRDIYFRKMESFKDKTSFAWRMVVPDNDGLLPDNPKCHPGFKGQLDLTDEITNFIPSLDLRH